MVTDNHVLKVIDFGLARQCRPHHDALTDYVQVLMRRELDCMCRKLTAANTELLEIRYKAMTITSFIQTGKAREGQSLGPEMESNSFA
jgi:hypothetical protein